MNNKGFTLVEMIAVVAIIALVGSLTIPSVLNSLNTGKESSDKILYKDIKDAIQIMYEEIYYTNSSVYSYNNDGKVNETPISISTNSINTNIQTLISNGYLNGINNEDKSINKNSKIVINSSGEDLGSCSVKITKIMDGNKVCYKVEGGTGICPTTDDFGGSNQCV